MKLYISMNRKPNTQCSICNKEIYRRPIQIQNGNVYCSRKCKGISDRKDIQCIVCNKTITTKYASKTCSRECSNKLRTGTKYDRNQTSNKHKKMFVIKTLLLNKRGNFCQLCKYDNVNVLQVHHIVEKSKGGSDDEENLLLICPNCHYTIHYGDSRLNGELV